MLFRCHALSAQLSTDNYTHKFSKISKCLLYLLAKLVLFLEVFGFCYFDVLHSLHNFIHAISVKFQSVN